jgi:hypothetical protein
MRTSGIALACSTAALMIGLASTAWAQDPTEFLVQMVCVDGANQPIYGDPVLCPNNRRKLQVGEALPYHKVDLGAAQISDSFPISDENGVNRAVQTYYFTDANGRDPLFPSVVHFTPVRGGYNIIGADSSFVFFSGTSDPGAHWSPWWTPNCQTRGWLLFPNNASAFSYGGAASPTTFRPQCAGSIATSPSTVEWTLYSNFLFRGDPAYPGSDRVLDTLAAYHFGPAFGPYTHGDLEISFLTREYGVTRWEAWKVGTGQTSDIVKNACPSMTYTDSFHNQPYYLADCRSWTRVIQPVGGSWNPSGSPAGDPTVRNWTVDPLYTSQNYLTNTTPLVSSADPNVCDQTGWFTVNSPNAMTVGRYLQNNSDPDDDAAWVGNFNCVPAIATTGTPSGAYAQSIPAPPASSEPYRFGALLLSPDVGSGSAQVNIQIIQRDSVGNLTGADTIAANVIQYERLFEGEFILAPGTTQVIFAVYPQQANTRFAITSAFVAR